MQREAMAKLLIIEDEVQVRHIVRLLLMPEGHEVVEAAYGQAGYSKAVSEKPDLILLDLMMPVMDGFDVLAKLKGNRVTRPIPVIILTSRIDAASERRCMQAGAEDYIKKPWGRGELEDRVRLALAYRPNRERKFDTRELRLDT